MTKTARNLPLYLMIAVCTAFLLLAPSARGQGRQDFTLVNKTGFDIYALYITPHSSNDWEEDVLGRDTLPNGESTPIHFNRKETAKMWDIRIEDKRGTAFEWENLNLLEISQVTLYYKDGKAWADTKGSQEFTVVNRTGFDIYALYITPHNSNDWEDDVLGRDTLPSGQETLIQFNRKETAKLWDVRIEDKRGTAFEWENLNLLEISQVILYYKDGKAWADTK